MNDFLQNLLVAIVSAGIPVLTAYLIVLIRTGVSKIKNENAAKYMIEIADAVSASVAMVSQTYVDELKKDGKFDCFSQSEALNKALQNCLENMSEKCKEFINEISEDATVYLTTKIEAEVRNQKLANGK